jgi:hypothetical protein
MAPVQRIGFGVFLVLAFSATLALAAGGKHPAGEPIGMIKDGWPAALPTAINSTGRVAGHWVNANDEFFYRGDNKALGEFFRRLAETKLPLTLVLHTNPQHRSVLWGDEPQLAYDWSLLIGTQGWTSPAWKLNFDDPKAKYALRVDVWFNGGLTADAIDVPAGARLSLDRGSPATTQPATRETSP